MKKKIKKWLYHILKFDKTTNWFPVTTIPPFGKEIVVWARQHSDGEIVAEKAVYGGSGFEGCGVEVLYWCYPPENK